MKSVVFAFLLITAAAAQKTFRICVQKNIDTDTCSMLERGDSRVYCLSVEDSVECAIKLTRGEADFGIFTAEDLLLAQQFYPTGIQIIAQLKNKDRTTEDFEFQSVAVVPTTYKSSEGTFEPLRNTGFCHPGFSQSQNWNDNVLKYFERKVYGKTCLQDLTAAENEAQNLKAFFKNACRPSNWVPEQTLDATLKKKYPELCSLCDDPWNCAYVNTESHGHHGALNCLTSGRGGVAYVALSHVHEYFTSHRKFPSEEGHNYQFLCVNGSVQPLTTTNPCAWVKQPWSAIVATDEHATELLQGLKIWLNTSSDTTVWTSALKRIITQDAVPEYFSDYTSLGAYLSRGREITPTTSSCGSAIRWCTTSGLEANKCRWVAAAATTHGIEPQISCDEKRSTFRCLRDIAHDRADVITIDSNYGHIARQVFNTATLLYSETDTHRRSIVLAVVREGATFNISSFSALKGRTACFPEYGGIAWLSFVNTARTHRIISDSCDYPTIVAELLGGACTPGIQDLDHSNFTSRSEFSSILCSLCPLESNQATCSANSSNIFYGDKGALECLSGGAGDIAFIEAQNLNEYIKNGLINEHRFRVLCKNDSLALHTGFNVDDPCALSTTIDSEVVSRKDISEIDQTDMTVALLKIDEWFGYTRPNILRPIHVFSAFNGTADLLFKDSSSGLVTTTSTVSYVLAYKELFRHLEVCSGADEISASFTILLPVMILAFQAFTTFFL